MRIVLLTVFTYYNVACFTPVHGKATSSHRCSMMPEEDGDCDGETDKWYYNKSEGKCVNFMYGDCPRGNNIFGSAEECEQECKKVGRKQVKNESSEENPRGGGRRHDEGSQETSRESGKGHGRGTKPGGSGTQHKKKQRRPGRPLKQKPTSVGKQRPTHGSEENEAGTSSESEKGHGGTQRPTKSGGQHHPKRRPTKPTKGRPGGGTKQWTPSPPSHSVKGTCGARPRRGQCEENSGMWYNDADFYTCSRVREGMCPTGGSFFESCEDCMRKCRRHMLKTCAYKT